MSHRCKVCDLAFRKFDARLQHEAEKHPAEVEKANRRRREAAAKIHSPFLAPLELRRAA